MTTTSTVPLTTLFGAIEVLETTGDPDHVTVTGVEHDSREVTPGALFCCLRGAHSDGREHAAEAIDRGAVAVVSDGALPASVSARAVCARVAEGEARPAMAKVAAAFYSNPSRTLLVAGVTGTNGKTTVTSLLGRVLEHAGHPTTVIGTLTGARTTPESTELQRLLAGARDAPRGGRGRPAVSMEVSSHALVQSRVDAIGFDVAVFTNLSHEHLDFHGTMEAYFDAKSILFEPERAAAAVVNADDEWGARLLARLSIPAVAVRASELAGVSLGIGSTTFVWRGREITTAMTGMVNVDNALLAAEAAVSLGVVPSVAAEALSGARPIRGRMERVATATQAVDVLVDYAHTPDALESVLGDLHTLARARGGRVIVCFGCGGDRDRAKRPMMGRVAARLADVTVVTSDNPRHEDPEAIIAEILLGAGDAHPIVEPDRREAIKTALGAARPGDVVLVAGKGHETEQVIGDTAFPFDDREEIVRVGGSGGAGGTGGPGAVLGRGH